MMNKTIFICLSLLVYNLSFTQWTETPIQEVCVICGRVIYGVRPVSNNIFFDNHMAATPSLNWMIPDSLRSTDMNVQYESGPICPNCRSRYWGEFYNIVHKTCLYQMDLLQKKRFEDYKHNRLLWKEWKAQELQEQIKSLNNELDSLRIRDIQ